MNTNYKIYSEIMSELGILRGILTKSKVPCGHLVIFVSGFSQVHNPHLGRNRRLSDEISDKYNLDTFRFDFNGVGESDGDIYDLNTRIMVLNLRDIFNHFKNQYKKISFITMSYGSNILKRFIYDYKINPSFTILLSPVFENIEKHYFLKIEDNLATDFELIKSEKQRSFKIDDFNSNLFYKDLFVNFGNAFSIIGDEDFDFNITAAKNFFEKNNIDHILVNGVNHGLAYNSKNNIIGGNKEIFNLILDKIGGIYE